MTTVARAAGGERTGSTRWVVWAIAAAMSAAFWTFALLVSARKPMWNDELYTFYVARLPAMTDVWHALLAGGEQTPPFFYVITRLSIAAFGLTALAIRLPEICAFWVAGLATGWFVARRHTALHGVAAASFLLVTGAYYYATEARPYALVLAFTALALVSWQSIDLGKRRRLWVPALAAALLGVVSAHYYGVFVVAAIATGELVRTGIRRRADPGVWGACAASFVPLALQLPLLRAGAAYSGAFWSPPQWVSIPDFYFNMLANGVVPLAGAAILLGLWAMTIGARVDTTGLPSPPLHETAALCALMAIPFGCVVAAKLVTGAFTNRYAIAAVIGFAAIAPMLPRRIAPPRIAAAILVMCCGTWFVLDSLRGLQAPQTIMPMTWGTIQNAEALIDAAPERDVPVAIADPHTFSVLSHYASPRVRARLVYLADPARAMTRLHSNSVERGMLDLVGPWFGMNVQHYDTFVASHPSYLVLGNFGALAFLNWLVPELQAEGAHMDLRAVDGERIFFYVGRDRNGHERVADTP